MACQCGIEGCLASRPEKKVEERLTPEFASILIEELLGRTGKNRRSSLLAPPRSGRERVLSLMRDGQWRTLEEIAGQTSMSEPSASARLRDLRKDEFGGWRVEKRLRDKDLYEYVVGGDDEY